MKQLRNGKRAAWNYRVMDVRKRLLSTKEAQETLASWVLSKPPKSIHNSIVTRCTLTISCITLALFYNIDFFSIGSRPAYMKSKSCDRSEVGIFSCAKSSWKLTSRFCVSLWGKNFIDTIWQTHFPSGDPEYSRPLTVPFFALFTFYYLVISHVRLSTPEKFYCE